MPDTSRAGIGMWTILRRALYSPPLPDQAAMPHSPAEKKKALTRLRRIQGQTDALARALEIVEQLPDIRSQANAPALPVREDFGDFWRELEWMGLQRHLKVLGIFCRLKHRDGKPKYSEDLPRFFAYAHKVATRYNGLGPLARLLEPLMGTSRIDAFY